ncbi:MAG: peptidoglycan/xylan/chitin deacetylase (PgdA/CDA1 family) [Myxococcota bacterium]
MLDRRAFMGGALASLAGCAVGPVVSRRELPEPELRYLKTPRRGPATEVGRSQLELPQWPIRTPASYGETLPGMYRSDRFYRVISLTFDDGPRPETTPWILDHLDEADVRATFFVIGRRAHKHPDLIREIVRRGHVIGNHTYNHKVLSRLKSGTVAKQANMTDVAVAEALGRPYRLNYFRPPYGNPFIGGANYNHSKARIKTVLRDQKRALVMWNIASGDTAKARTFEAMAGNMRPYMRDGRGGVMVLHDTAPWTARALPKLIRYLRDGGYEFRSLDGMLQRKYGVRLQSCATTPESLWVTA